MLRYEIPRWYQELSFSQIRRVLALGQVIKYDFNETVTGRTRKMLREIGVTSTFVKIPSRTLKKLFESSKLDASRFLCEVYRYITGNYFVDEEYKKFYDCNERIVLSAIAILELSRTIIELHRRLPMGVPRYVAQKPLEPKPPPRRLSTSPYLEDLFEPPNWRQYKRETETWRRKSNAIVLPQVILPKAYVCNQRRKSLLQSLTPRRINFQAIRRKNRRKSRSHSRESKFTQSRLPRKKSPAKPSPETRDEDILLKLLSKPKKYYPPGRENLSQRWQDWFCNLEEDFEKFEREADCILNNVRTTTQLIFNSDVCTDCCGCRKVSENGKRPKNLIDSIAFDPKGKNRRVIGALVPDLSVESLSGSLLELPRIIPSTEKNLKTRVISGIVTDTAGKKTQHINESVKYVQHIARKIKYFPIPVKNVLPCACKRESDLEQYCWERNERNRIFIDFEKACKEREKKRKLNNTPVDPLRKSREANDEKIIAVEQENCLQCAEPGKECLTNHLKTVMRTIDEEKRLNCPRVTQNGEKVYRDNIKFAVGGISRNDKNQIDYVLSNVTLHTPITITPELTSSSSSSQSNLLNSMSQHRHWSVTLFTPKAREKISNSTKQPGQEFLQEDTNDLFKNLQNFNNIKTDPIAQEENFKIAIDTENSSIEFVVDEEKSEKTRSDVQTTKVDDKKHDKAVSIASIEKKLMENIKNPENKLPMEEEKNDGQNDNLEEEDNLENLRETTKKDMISLMKLALNEMSEEGFLLAQLPQSYRMPQLQAWAMFREGFIITEKLKQNLLEKTKQMWASMESTKLEKISPELLAKKSSNIKKLKQEIELKKQLFYSKIRKLRVLRSRTMWNLMNYEMFPCLTFKKAYFTYQASKEADGVVQRPYGVILSKT